MGHPRHQVKKYSGPTHPWQRSRIEEEKALQKKYGLKNKREIWKMKGLLRKYASQAKRLTKTRTAQTEVEKKQLLAKLQSYGLLKETSPLSDVLNLSVSDFMERRLQTVLCKKGLARTPNQARQFIVHCHVRVGDKLMTVPSYLVRKEEEGNVNIRVESSFFDPAHPERSKPAKEAPAPKPEKSERRPRRERN